MAWVWRLCPPLWVCCLFVLFVLLVSAVKCCASWHKGFAMSRVAIILVVIPAKVEVALTADSIAVSGPLGKISHFLTSDVTITREGDAIQVKAANDSQQSRAMSGTMRALVANMVQGVSQGFSRKLT